MAAADADDDFADVERVRGARDEGTNASTVMMAIVATMAAAACGIFMVS